MHELSIALNILEAAEDESERRGGVRVEAIYLKLGVLSGVVTEALLSAYQIASAQTPFASCRLLVEEVPIMIDCPNCQEGRPVRSMQCFECSECGAPGSDIVHGRELEICALELAEAFDACCPCEERAE